MIKKIVLALLLIGFTLSAWAENSERAIFVSVIENQPVLESHDEMTRLIDFAQHAHVKILFVQVYRGGKSWFPSTVADTTPYQEAFVKVGEDPFALLIREAHAAGIQVHAWMNILSLSDNSEAPILKKYGREILTRNKNVKKEITDYLIDNQYWLEPGDLKVRSELSKLVAEVVTVYPELDGVQLDYIRYPDTKPAYGHTMENLKRFAKNTELKQFTEKTEEWRKWKRDQVTEFVKVLANRARLIHPSIQFSTTGCASYSRAREEAFQDWGEWLNRGVVDFVTMMNYPNNLDEFKKYVDGAKEKVDDFSKVHLGVGAYKFIDSPAVFNDIWNQCEADMSKGCTVFYYGSLRESNELKDVLLNRFVKKEDSLVASDEKSNEDQLTLDSFVSDPTLSL